MNIKLFYFLIVINFIFIYKDSFKSENTKMLIK